MRIRYITERLESEGWELNDSQFQKIIASKGNEKFEASNWNDLYFLIHKPKEKCK